ncbi:MAG: molybdopterin-dependent oxidoreductase [Deltaproteobacteria bacterium]|nr:molybdopterin-dependent oxidoreductase [Deltaproteobacteria bacterium]
MNPLTRRGFLKGASVTAGASTLLGEGKAHGDEGNGKLLVLRAEEKMEVHAQLNGASVSLNCAPMSSLADALRSAGYTGTKTACEGGACGACSVILNGKLVNSCLVLAFDVEGKEIRTIEGLGTEKALHPLQQAFIDADALQCGFCTPGMLMAATSFYEEWRVQRGDTRPSKQEVQHALAGNLCRCGAHPSIVQAIQAACSVKEAVCAGGKVPGHALSRVDALEKVTGRAKYAIDVQQENMHYAAVLRSPVGHAEIISLDVSAAQKMPGVVAVEVVVPQAAGEKFGKLRWVGQEIAAVAAKTEAQAEAALAALNLSLKELPVVTTRDAAQEKDAATVWNAPENQDVPTASEGVPSPAFAFPWNGNARGPANWPLATQSDEAKQQCATAKVRNQMSFSTSTQVHIPLERHGCVADHRGDSLTVWATTQTVHILADDLAEVFELPRTKVRVISPYVGGGFGCKAGARPEHLAAVRLSKKAKVPVRLFYRWQDQLAVGGNRPGTHQEISLAASETGKLTHVVHQSENLCGAAVGESSTGLTKSHYAFSQMDLADISVVTHAPPACPWRAPGFPPNAFSLEQAVDDVAVQVAQDPLLLRMAQEKRRRARGVYRMVQERANYGARLSWVGRDQGRYRRGVGVASGEWFVLSAPNCRVRLKATRDGWFEVATGTQDMGQGSRTVLRSVVSNLLGIDPSRVDVVVGDSDLPMAPGSFGSISTASIAPAAQHAVEELRKALFQRAKAEYRGARLEANGVTDEDGRRHSFSELCALLDEDPFVVEGIRGADHNGFTFPPRIFDAIVEHSPMAIGNDTPLSVHIAEVEVDTLTGAVVVKKVTAGIDAGRIASPKTAQSQVVGAVMQGISFALFENRRLCPRTGGLLSSSLDHYGILGMADAPEVDVCFYESESEHNPYGSIGLGENSIVAVAAAVANAIFRATGKRVRQTPMTPSTVLASLRSSKEEK